MPKGKRGPGFKASASKPRTVRNKLKLVRQLLRWAPKRGLLMVDPAVGYDLPPTVMKVMGHDSLDIVLMYCHATDEELIKAIITVPFERMVAASEKGGGNVAHN